MKTTTMLAALLAMTLSPALAEQGNPQAYPDPARPESPAATSQDGRASEKPRKVNKRVGKLMKEFGASEAEIKGLRDQGLGWGDVRSALAISKKSGQPVTEVMRLHDSGLSWNDISQRHGFEFEDLNTSSTGHGRDDLRDAVGERRPYGRGGHKSKWPGGTDASGTDNSTGVGTGVPTEPSKGTGTEQTAPVAPIDTQTAPR
ncbi:MAG: hypothetical protein HYZ75_19430 [Elusimicrobia bacterium]|nr:hypothetical protein [Elusimicrobiota bacterium]